jgi:hypothetical protein
VVALRHMSARALAKALQTAFALYAHEVYIGSQRRTTNCWSSRLLLRLGLDAIARDCCLGLHTEVDDRYSR